MGSGGTALNGTLQNAGLTNGHFGQAPDFTVANPGVITNNPATIGNAFTFSARVPRPTGTRALPGSSKTAMPLRLPGTDTSNPGQYTAVLVYSRTTCRRFRLFRGVSVQANGLWNMVTSTWDGTTERIYYDGTLVYSAASRSFDTSFTGLFRFRLLPLLYPVGPYMSLVERQHGLDAYVYSRALSPPRSSRPPDAAGTTDNVLLRRRPPRSARAKRCTWATSTR